MSYGTGRFSNLDLPDPTLAYVARKAFKHHDLTFAPGDPVTVEQIGSRHLVKYVRARLIEMPATGAGLDDLQRGVAGPEDAAAATTAAAADNINPETMTKAELFELIDARGLPVDKRLALGALRAKVAAALDA